MGRHADPDRSLYYRSLAAALGKGAAALLAVVVVVVGAIWFMNQRDNGVELVSPDDEETAPADSDPVDLEDFRDDEDVVDDGVAVEELEDPDAEEDPENAEGDEGDPDADADPEGNDDPDAEDGADEGDEGDEAPDEEGDPEGEEEPGDIDPASIRVQVLDGGVGPEVTEAAADVVRELGYEVPVIDTASCCYSETTVLFNEGQEAAADDLVQRDERFRGTGPNPNLTAEVEIHVIVGEDWPTE